MIVYTKEEKGESSYIGRNETKNAKVDMPTNDKVRIEKKEWIVSRRRCITTGNGAICHGCFRKTKGE